MVDESHVAGETDGTGFDDSDATDDPDDPDGFDGSDDFDVIQGQEMESDLLVTAHLHSHIQSHWAVFCWTLPLIDQMVDPETGNKYFCNKGNFMRSSVVILTWYYFKV